MNMEKTHKIKINRSHTGMSCMNILYIIRLIYHIRWENNKEKATISILNISLSIRSIEDY